MSLGDGGRAEATWTETGSARIAAAFGTTEGRAALMPYLMGGFPDLDVVLAHG